MSESESVTMEMHSLTQDTGNPVYKVRKGDGTIEVVEADDALIIPIVMCGGETSMSTLVEYAVRELEETTVKFASILNEELINKLHGFDQTYEYDQAGRQVEIWVGEWELDH